MWSRRKFIETSILSQLAINSGTLSLLYSCVSEENSSTVMSASLQKILAAAMDEIIPAGDEMPAASETGGLNYILKLLEQFPEQAKSLSTGLTRLNDQCEKKFNKDFTKISSDERITLLKETEKSNTPFFSQLLNLTYESYYLSPAVWKLIDYDPHPTLSSGPLMEAFDEKLLDRVRSLPTIFKEI
jgi:hypothetical protein